VATTGAAAARKDFLSCRRFFCDRTAAGVSRPAVSYQGLAWTSSEDLSTLFAQENEEPAHLLRRHPMKKQQKQPTGQPQDQAAVQPVAEVEQDRQAAQQQDRSNHEKTPKQSTSASDHSQDADRHSKTKHVHSQK